MTMRKSRKSPHAVLTALALGASVFVLGLAGTACKKEEPSRWEAAAKSAEVKKDAPPDDKPKPPVAEGATLNKFFPPEAVDGKKRTFTAEKDGYVEAKLTADGKDVAMLSVTDFNGKAEDLAKFDKSTEKLGEFPLLMPTKKQTSILVGKRYQVKVSSDAMTPDDRKAFLQKFDLKGLSSFVPTAK